MHLLVFFEGVYQCPVVAFGILYNDQSLLDPKDQKQVCIFRASKDCRYSFQVSDH